MAQSHMALRAIVGPPVNADAVAQWAKDVRGGQRGPGGQSGQGRAVGASIKSTPSTLSTYAEIAANGVLALIAVASSLLKRQLASLEKAFVAEGGFTERLYRVRSQRRNRG